MKTIKIELRPTDAKQMQHVLNLLWDSISENGMIEKLALPVTDLTALYDLLEAVNDSIDNH